MSLRRAVACLLALLLAGCSTTVPSTGPVEKVAPAAQGRVERGVRVQPAPPQEDVAPDVVLAGFLDAMASLEPGFGVARQYLTPKAARSWDPHAGVIVYDGDTRSSLPGSTTAGLQARVVGTLDAQGHYTASTGRLIRQNFTMHQVDGQWRISNPPSGLLVSQYTLLNRFTPAQVWFQGLDAHTLVPERVWLASSPASPLEAVQALLDGPSRWLEVSVTTAFPAGTRLTVDAVTVTGGVAEVPLDGRIAALPDAQRSQLVSQVGTTLKAFPDIRAVRILCDGQPWNAPGQTASGEVPLDALPGMPSIPLEGDEQPFAVVGNAVGRLDDQGAFSPLGGRLGRNQWGDRPGELAVSTTAGVVALVNHGRTRLVTSRLGQDEVSPRLTGTGLASPVVTATGVVWAVVDADGEVALRRASGTQNLAPVRVPSLKGSRILQVAVAPDQTRMAVVLRRGGRSELALLRIHGGVVDGLRRIPLEVSQLSLEEVVDAAWTGPEQLMVLAAQHPGARPSAFLISADASQVDPVGPAGELDLVQVTARAQQRGAPVLLRASSGEVLRHVSAWRWHILPHRVRSLAVPS